jgi:hypothetical protein
VPTRFERRPRPPLELGRPRRSGIALIDPLFEPRKQLARELVAFFVGKGQDVLQESLGVRVHDEESVAR